jgi:hypothetical protein
MGRNRMFTDDQVKAIQDDSRQYKDIAKDYNTTILTIGKIKRKEGAYRDLPSTLGTPVLNAHGITINVIPPEEPEVFIPFIPPVRHN